MTAKRLIKFLWHIDDLERYYSVFEDFSSISSAALSFMVKKKSLMTVGPSSITQNDLGTRYHIMGRTGSNSKTASEISIFRNLNTG